jgi:hypothetical protein
MGSGARPRARSRSAGSYKEEVLRYIHAQPSGVISDDRVGVSALIGDALVEKGLPISPSTVSAAIHALRNEGKITVEYGHRSLDNKLLFTSATVHSEPLSGVAVGPSEPVQKRQPLSRAGDDIDAINSLLQQLRRLVGTTKPPTSDEIERFQLHVDHLIAENQEWETVAQEVEDGLTSTVEQLRGELSSRDEQHRIEIERLVGQHQQELSAARHQAVTLRERGERYRVSMESEREIAATLRRERDAAVEHEAQVVREHEQAVEGLTAKIEERTLMVAQQHADIGRLRSEIQRVVRLSRVREAEMVASILIPVMSFVGDSFRILNRLSRMGSKIVVSDDVLQILGVLDESGQESNTFTTSPEEMAAAVRQIGIDNNLPWVNISILNNDVSKGAATRQLISMVRRTIDLRTEPLVTDEHG